ncbi:MAG TPA: hypothetical protein EYN66_23615, partial [Myxococcales bacterium]|nr:hypothetical protein [Myxococcales bacterium]
RSRAAAARARPKPQPKPRPVPSSKKVSKERPGWIDQPPLETGMLYGTGEAPTVQEAFGQATAMISAQVQVTIQSELVDEKSSHAHASSRNGGNIQTSVQTSEHVRSTSKMVTHEVLEDVIIVDQYRDPKNQNFHVLAALDVAAIAAKEDAIVTAALTALSLAAEKLASQRTEGNALSQEALFELAAVLGDVRALGRSRIGKKVREQWEKPFRKFRRLINRALTCVEVTLTDENHITASCNGGAIANARLRTFVKGGLVELPKYIETDGAGVAKLKYGHVYGGNGVRVGFMHDLRGVAGSRWLSPEKPANKSWVSLDATRPLTVRLTVLGTRNKAEFRETAEALGSWVRRKWGAKITRRKGEIQVTLKLTFGNIAPVGSKFALSTTLALSAISSSGPIVDRTGQAGALGSSEEDVRKRALKSVIQKFQKW